jgi:predicted nucleic acid-binding protein
MLDELAKVLRYERLRKRYNLSDELRDDYLAFLRRSSDIVSLNPAVIAPIRDPNDVIVMQTAIIGQADVLCTRDKDFFEEPACEYLKKIGITVMNDIVLLRQLRSQPIHDPAI